jgi:hypothetical protein
VTAYSGEPVSRIDSFSSSSSIRFSAATGTVLRSRQPLAEAVDIGGAVVLGDAEFLLDGLELLAQKELALVLAHLLLDLLADVGLELGDFQFLFDQHDDFFHPLQNRRDGEDFLQFLLAGRGQAGGEIGQRRGIVGVEAVEEEFQFLGIQRVERDQLLERVDDRQRIGAQFIDVGLVVLVQILDLDMIGRLVDNQL